MKLLPRTLPTRSAKNIESVCLANENKSPEGDILGARHWEAQIEFRAGSVEIVLVPAIARPIDLTEIVKPVDEALRAFSDRRHVQPPWVRVRWLTTYCASGQGELMAITSWRFGAVIG